MTQDANQRKENSGKAKDEWQFIKYDAFGRTAYTGIIADDRDRSVIQEEVNDLTTALWVESSNAVMIGGVTMYYNNGGYPNTQNAEVLSITYYDNYDFLGSEGAFFNNPTTVYGVSVSDRTKSLITGTKVKTLDTSYWTTTVSYFDKKGRSIYAASSNEYLNTTNIVATKLDFVGKVEKTKTTHKKGSNAPIVTEDVFEYDHMGRATKQTQIINGQQEVIAENSYDELGQLASKKVGNGLQDIKYHYNVRGWLKGINDVSNLGNALFAYNINYNTTDHGVTPQYKYNIAEIDWKTASDNTQRWYAYNYNAFEQPLSVTSNNSKYSVSNITYDRMGNLQSLTRNGWQNSSSYTNLDVLSYQYAASSNKLLSVTDSGNKTYGFKDRNISGNDYAYDINGNLIQDKNKGITSVAYNHFNFPTRIEVTNPDHEGNLQYVYDANGVKLKKTAVDRGTTNVLEYNSNFVYENGSLKSITHPEGYIEQEDDGSFTYVYEHRDIWNNTRITYADNNKDGIVTAAEIRREQNYYPFGMSWQAVNSTIRNAKNNLKTFQSQELTEDLGLNTHEWRYRVSDPATGRFWQIDPLAEDYTYNSTYAFQENKMGMGVELEGTELLGLDIAVYAAQKTVEFQNNTAGARSKLGEAVGNRVEVLRTGQEKNNAKVANYNVNQVQDAMVITESVNEIGKEAANTAKEITRDGANGLENSGDALTIAGAATLQPEIVLVGETMSGIGTGMNVTLDIVEGKPASQILVENVPQALVGKLGDKAVDAMKKSNNNVSKKIDQSIIKGLEKLYENVIDMITPSTPPATPPGK